MTADLMWNAGLVGPIARCTGSL